MGVGDPASSGFHFARCVCPLLAYSVESAPVKVLFFDRQNLANPLNGTTIDKSQSLRAIIQGQQPRQPFLSELIGENGHKLLVGLGATEGCVQFSSADGAPPYLMAVREDLEQEGSVQDFLIGNTATPVAHRFCLPMEKVAEIAIHFLESGERSVSVGSPLGWGWIRIAAG